MKHGTYVIRKMQHLRKITSKRIYLAMGHTGEYFSARREPERCEKSRGGLDGPSDNSFGDRAGGALPSLCLFSTLRGKPPASRGASDRLRVNSVIQGAENP